MRNARRPTTMPDTPGWALNRLSYRLFTSRWFWLVIGLFVGGVGVPILLAPPLHFVPITGTLASDSGANMTLHLVGDGTAYTFTNNFPFNPPLPTHIPSGTTVRIWIDRGYTQIDALQFIGPGGTPEATYEDPPFANPTMQGRETLITGVFFTTFGGFCALLCLCWPLLVRASRRGQQP